MKRSKKHDAREQADFDPPAPPRDWAHAHAELEERLTRRITAIEVTIEGFVTAHSQMTGQPLSTARAAAETLRAASNYRDAETNLAARVVPAGVVPPHVRANLDALAEWTNPDRWQPATNAPPDEVARLRTVLDHIHGLVMIAMAGEDVPRPT